MVAVIAERKRSTSPLIESESALAASDYIYDKVTGTPPKPKSNPIDELESSIAEAVPVTGENLSYPKDSADENHSQYPQEAFELFLGKIEKLIDGEAVVELEAPDGTLFTAKRDVGQFGDVDVEEGTYFNCRLVTARDGRQLVEITPYESSTPNVSGLVKDAISRELDEIFGEE